MVWGSQSAELTQNQGWSNNETRCVCACSAHAVLKSRSEKRKITAVLKKLQTLKINYTNMEIRIPVLFSKSARIYLGLNLIGSGSMKNMFGAEPE